MFVVSFPFARVDFCVSNQVRPHVIASRFVQTKPFRLMSLLFFDMSTTDRRSVCASRDDYPIRHRVVSIQRFRKGCFVNDGSANDQDSDGSARFPLGAPTFSSSVLAPVNVTKYINIFFSVLDARRLAAMHHDLKKLGFVNARSGRRHNTALSAWMRG